jgi:predicted GIY-YIG superfamily endonuclease
MIKPQVKEHNSQTGEEITREMTDVELIQYKAFQEAALQAIEDAKAAEIAKEIAQAKLAALGLTADDLKALGL